MENLDPNSSFDDEFNQPDLAKDSISTYKTQSKIVKSYFVNLKSVKDSLLNYEFYIPKELCTGELISSFLKYDYTNEKHKNSGQKYYFRIRKLRGYISHSLHHHNLEPIQNIKGKRISKSRWLKTETVLSKIYKKDEIKKQKKPEKKIFSH